HGRGRSRGRLLQKREVHRLGALAALVRLRVERHLLTVLEAWKAGGLHRRNVDEHVLGVVIRLDEAEPLGMIEELDRSRLRHGIAPYLPYCTSGTVATVRAFGRSLGEKKQRHRGVALPVTLRRAPPGS